MNFQRNDWAPGLEGENVFYTGNNLFWGLDVSGLHDAENWSWWSSEIHKWHNIDGNVYGNAVWDPTFSVAFPTTGLQ
jgi:hypothetical protein